MSRLIADLHPAFRPMAEAFLAEVERAGLDVIVTCTKRTLEEQAELYAQGRTKPGDIVTKAKPGTSSHNYGLGMDVVLMINGKPDWTGMNKGWSQLGKIGMGLGLTWFGAPGSPFYEMPHFQHPDWRRVAGLVN